MDLERQVTLDCGTETAPGAGAEGHTRRMEARLTTAKVLLSMAWRVVLFRCSAASKPMKRAANKPWPREVSTGHSARITVTG